MKTLQDAVEFPRKMISELESQSLQIFRTWPRNREGSFSKTSSSRLPRSCRLFHFTLLRNMVRIYLDYTYSIANSLHSLTAVTAEEEYSFSPAVT